MTRHEKESWRNWTQDYFLERPVAVICEGCGKHYAKGKDAAFMRFEGYRLIECSECQRLATPPPKGNRKSGKSDDCQTYRAHRRSR